MRLDRQTAEVMRTLARHQGVSLSALLEDMLREYALARGYELVLDDGTVERGPTEPGQGLFEGQQVPTPPVPKQRGNRSKASDTAELRPWTARVGERRTAAKPVPKPSERRKRPRRAKDKIEVHS
jgi:hypothetical protein